MSYGRGRGRGGFSTQRFCKEEEWKLFPEISEYPTVDLKEVNKKFTDLVSWGHGLQKFWMQSSYHLDDASQGAQKNRGLKRPPLSDFMKMTDDYVPAELVSKNARRNNKKVRWDSQSDLQRLDDFLKLDRITGGKDDDDDEKKEGEDEDGEEDIENAEEEEEELNDYTENAECDDDEDDFNPQDDGGDDEGFY